MTVRRQLFALFVLIAILLIPLAVPRWSASSSAAASGLLDWVVTGNFQDEISSCADWDNACAETQMEDTDGDGVYRFVTDLLPSGIYEYKVVESGNWGNAFPPDNVIFSADGSELRWYFEPGTTRVMDNANQCIATVVGDFQDELGGNEWDPTNLRTLMWQEEAGSDWYATTETIPAGEWAYKVARDEGWAASHPDDNVLLSLSDTTEVTFRYNCATNEVQDSVNNAQSDEELVRPVVQHPIQDDIFYFVLPDRFENGDPSNDTGGIAGTRLDHGFDPTDKGFYHGGDFAGILDRMGYLENLGITSIWMTPIFKNKPVQGSGSDASAGYHGYWILDYTDTDPHFGTLVELTNLVTSVHGLDIKLFFDIITNHTADVIKYQEGQYNYVSKADFPYRDANGVIFDDKDYAGTGTFPPLDPDVSFPYTPVFEDPADGSIKVPDWLNDRTLYHNRGDSTFSGESSEYGDFFGLDDLFTEHFAVVDGMTDIYQQWISDVGIDGYRVDTVKHVNMEFWRDWVPAVMDHAAAEGDPDFFIFGEVFDSNAAFMSQYTTDPDFPAVLDFGFQSVAPSFAANGSPTNVLRDFFLNDDYFTDEDSNVYQLPVFLGNHDIGRVGRTIQLANPTAPDSEWVARSELAHGLMYFARGVPIIYYGDEQGFVGDGGDKDARQDMFPSQVASYNDDDLIGTTATTADSNFDESHPLYQAFAEYGDLYQNHVALRRGAQIHRYSSDSAGIYAFSRIDRDEQIEYVIAFNNAEASSQATFGVYQANESFTPIYPTLNDAAGGVIISDADGQLTVTVPALSFAIYRATNALPPSSAAPAISIDSPQDGEAVLGRVEIAASLDSDQLAEVTFAVRVGDDVEYTPIGTDNNPPYRLFYDTSALEVGTALSFKAIVNDLNDHYSSDSVNVTVGEEDNSCVAHNGYAVIHYFRDDGNYGNYSSTNYNDFWGLHLWGDAITPEEQTSWTEPKKMNGQDDYGLFAFIELADDTQPLNFILHRGDEKDPPNSPDRSFIPRETPEVWLRQGDLTIHTSQASAQGYVNIFYHRDDGNYGNYSSTNYNDFWGLHLWTEDGDITPWTEPLKADEITDYGARFTVTADMLPSGSTWETALNFIVHKGDEKDPPNSPDRSFVPADNAAIWLQSGELEVYESRAAAEDYALLHYHRFDGDYGTWPSANYNDFWGLHVWNGAVNPTSWPEPIPPSGTDLFGVYYQVPLVEDATELAYILHRGDEKDLPDDQFLNLNQWGHEVWIVQSTPGYLLPMDDCGVVAGGDLTKEQAHWVDEETIAWDIDPAGIEEFALYYSEDAGLTLTDTGIEGGTAISLTVDPAGLPLPVVEKFPHLAGYTALKLPPDALDDVPMILKGQTAVAAIDDGIVADATGLQIPGVLDDLYTYEGNLGVTWDSNGSPLIQLWAPTAQTVTLHRFVDATTTTSTTYPMTYDPATGVWSLAGDSSWEWQYYLYEITVYSNASHEIETHLVTDPYSHNLSMNSQRTQIIDLSDPSLIPTGWAGLQKPEFGGFESISVYELHMRDFSRNDPAVPEALIGTYLAFTLDGTNGTNHLQALADAGLTHLHLLPVFDIATVNEDKSQWQEADWSLLASYPPASEMQQQIIASIKGEDAFNWGYDPYHYTVPEGSYSTDPMGTARIIEFRQMVMALNQMGLRVVMDVVYNHTNASGLAEKSVLDKIVPGYYHRLDEDGNVATSTCCANTASEHNMMEKLMVDSLLTWATDYKVDAFRFDLMGHHMKSNMLEVQQRLGDLTVANSGVDGSEIYLYGEGWNFGEVANNARGVNATQFNMAGTGIGTFNDRLRDAARGGGPFDSGEALRANQGLINGLYYDPNDLNSGSQAELDELLLSMDQTRVGLAGNLADYEFVDRFGNTVTGAEVDYNGSPTGYTQDPQENIVYVSKHDNQTLFDNNQYKMPTDATLDERVRAQNMGLSIAALSQGVSFFHAGSDMLRSKSLDRDSYDSGDWFNKLDFTYQDNNWGVGLPIEEVNGENWPIMAPLLSTLPAPSPDNITDNVAHYQEMLQIVESSPLFSLSTEAEVQARLRFHNVGPSQIPGLIVMTLSDETGESIDPLYENVIVLFNASDEPQSFTIAELANRTIELHPVQMVSNDPVVQTSSYSAATGTFVVPARTTAVFVEVENPTAISHSNLTSTGHINVALPLLLIAGPLAVGLALALRRRREGVVSRSQ
ncbi:MAG: pullulanase-type alpha-1,6-glucosidase [Ardenticatenales bacterium]|nr:pullulanase-type alpha-1,6-glucosidase [Ardenticatenales bacterium]